MEFHPCATIDYSIPSSKNPHHSENGHVCRSNLQHIPNGPSYLAVDKSARWKKDKGEFVTVFLMDLGRPSKKVKDAVMTYAKLWEDYCDIQFQFVQIPTADIRVSFQQTVGNLSYIGTYREGVGETDATMNLSFSDHTSNKDMRGITLHEFGHALGCVHEHQSPNLTIQWDEKAVFDWHEVHRPEWKEDMIRKQILNRAEPGPDGFLTSAHFDSKSIMIYRIPLGWATNITSEIASTYDLSEYDKQLIGEMYPQNSNDTRRFNTPKTEAIGPPRLLHSQSIQLNSYNMFTPPPDITVGLTSLNIGAAENVRIRTIADQITVTDFKIHVDSWYNTHLRAAGTTWLDTPSDSFIQVGTFNTTECRMWDKPEPKASKPIQFERAFKKIPTIVVWLNWIDSDNSRDTKIRAYTSKIGLAGFTIHIDSGDNSILYSGGASWIAYESCMENITSGIIKTTRVKDNPNYEQTDSIMFRDGWFNRLPQVVLAVTSVDFAQGKDVDFDMSVKSVDRNKLVWRIKSSSTSMCRAIDATYIALGV